MKRSQAIEQVSTAYFKFYNVNLSLLTLPSEKINPIITSFRTNELSLKEACTLLNNEIILIGSDHNDFYKWVQCYKSQNINIGPINESLIILFEDVNNCKLSIMSRNIILGNK